MELSYLCRVFFLHSGNLIPAGSLLAPFKPSGADIFRATKEIDFETAATSAVHSGVVKNTQHFWDALETCKHKPELVVYCPYSKADMKIIFENGGDLSTVCSLPIVVFPA